MIDTKRAGQLVDLMDMKKGEASVAVVENWWNSKYLLDKIRNSESFQNRWHSQTMLQSLFENFNSLTQKLFCFFLSWSQLHTPRCI